MKKILFILTLLLVVSNRGYAKGFPVAVASESPANIYSADDKEEKKTKVDSIEVRGKLVDSFTYEVVDSVWVELYSLPDTVLVDTAWNYRQHHMDMRGWEWFVDGFFCKIPVHGQYLLRTTKRGYKPLDHVFEVPRRRYNKKVREWDLDEVRIHKANSYGMERDLDEFTVTATKVKMVMKGDTVVFNADAFQLSEGSMLDALVRQLPGVEIRKGGEIYINGNKMDELLVNGKDFFNGDAKVALENLPAYTVQNIKAYQKESKYAYLDKHHDAMKKKDPWVLDVGLKREYAQGWLGNVEAGYGWDKRWMGRLFGIRYTDHSRITVFANANNTNDNSRPGNETSWANVSTPTSEIKTLTGGVDFHVDDKVTKTEFNTSLEGSRSEVDGESLTSSQTFLEGGDVWRRARSVNSSKSGSLHWNGGVEFRKKEFFGRLGGNVNYSKGNSRGRNESATFSQDPLDASRGASLDSARVSVSLSQQYAPLFSSRLRDALTNYTEDLTKSTNHHFSPGVHAMFFTVAPWNGEHVSFNISDNFSRSSSEDFSHYDLRQQTQTGGLQLRPEATSGQGDAAFTQDFRNRYTESPQRSNNFSLNVGHSLISYKDIFTVGMEYGYAHSYSRGQRDLYRLDELTTPDGHRPWGAGTDYPLGMLPSMRDSLRLCVDAANSYFSINRNQSHDLRLRVHGGDEKWGYYFLSATLNRRNEHSEDTRGDDYQDLSRKINLFSANASGHFRDAELSVSYNQSAPGITQMLDVRDDSNPLSISLGNPDLKNTYNFSTGLSYNHNSAEKQSSWHIGVDYNRGSAIGNATIYNRETGVYTYQPRNVDGNWGTSVNTYFNTPLDPKKRLTFNNSLSANYNRSVDFSGDNPAADFDHLPLSKVHNYYVGDWMSMEYRYEEYSVSANAEVDYNHAMSDRPGFMVINTVGFSYGVTCRLNFRHGYYFGMDLTMHSRRGYEDKTMNDNNLVWNAAVSKSFFKNKCFVLRLTGHDILQQLTNVRQSVNAQGRTETWYNTQPSYVLLSASYRLDMKPKKMRE